MANTLRLRICPRLPVEVYFIREPVTTQEYFKMKSCKTCELIARRDAGTAPLWDCIHRTQFWDVVHSYNTALPGWLVLVVRRHIVAIDELTEDEAVELGVMIRQTSMALKAVTGCVKTYVIQFAEQAEHPHVHFHIVPRMANQPEERRSTKIFEYMGVPEAERVNEKTMNAIATEVRRLLLSWK
jgi:diadenosine tetraphosphate (Ap4A) HIT family hydrolase